ncbi:MAG: hypothetical protein ACP5N9_05580 [Candidatus Bilamarchaeum sp.]|jgi:hypothetical protein
MFLLTTQFWIELLEKNEDRKNELKLYDKDTILLTPIILSEVSDYFIRKKNFRISNWFLEYSTNTENVRIIYTSKDENNLIIKLTNEKELSYNEATNQYIAEYFGAKIVL